MIPQGSLLGTLVLVMTSASLCLSGGRATAAEGGTPPKIISSCLVQPAYPEAEKEAGVEGEVQLTVEVKADGTVGSIRPKLEVPGHPGFTAAASAAVEKWCFEPAQEDGKPVKATVIIPVRFRLDEKKK